jgi:hypothetical protein
MHQDELNFFLLVPKRDSLEKHVQGTWRMNKEWSLWISNVFMAKMRKRNELVDNATWFYHSNVCSRKEAMYTLFTLSQKSSFHLKKLLILLNFKWKNHSKFNLFHIWCLKITNLLLESFEQYQICGLVFLRKNF